MLFTKITFFDIIQIRAKVGYTSPDQFILSQNLTSANKALGSWVLGLGSWHTGLFWKRQSFYEGSG